MADTEFVHSHDGSVIMRTLEEDGTWLTTHLQPGAGVPVTDPCDVPASPQPVIPALTPTAPIASYEPPYVEVLGSQLRAKQQELELMTARWHAAEARLFDATVEARKQQVEADNQAMLQRLEASAPPGMTWNQATGHYVAKAPQ